MLKRLSEIADDPYRGRRRWLKSGVDYDDPPLESFFDQDLKVIQIWTGNCHYGVDLDRLTDSAEILDFVLQVNGKTWENKRAVRDFCECLELACAIFFDDSAQGVCCPWGKFAKIEWPATEQKP